MYLRSLSNIWKILLISLFLVLISGCEDEINLSQDSGSKDIPDEQSDAVKIVTLEGEIITMEMYARHIDRYYKRKETFIDSLYLKNFDEQGELKSTLTCEKANIDETKNEVICTGNVVVISANGRLETPKLTWNRDSDEVLAENGVKLLRGDDTLWGERMITDLELNNIEIIKVSAEGTIKNGSVEW